MKTLALILFSLTLSAAAQLPLGSVNDVQPTACTAGFASGSTCHSATVSCPGVSDIAVTFGVSGNPAAGTIVFINGSGDIHRAEALPFSKLIPRRDSRSQNSFLQQLGKMEEMFWHPRVGRRRC